MGPTKGAGRTGQQKRHVGAQSAGKVEQFRAGDWTPGQLIGQLERRGRVGGTPAEAGRHRNPFGERQRDSEPSTRGVEHHPGGSDREVFLRRSEVRAVDRERDLPGLIGAGDPQFVGERDPLEQRLDAVIPVLFDGEDPEKHVDLGPRGGAQFHSGHTGRLRRGGSFPGPIGDSSRSGGARRDPTP